MARNGAALIASGASLSNAIDLSESDTLIAIEIPAAWTAAALTFAVDGNGDGVFSPVFDEGGTELSVASASVVAGRYVILNATTFARLSGQIKIRSGTNAAAVTQGADRVLLLSLAKRWI